MRPWLVLVLTWLLAVGVASAIGFTAIGLVGDVLRDRGPIGASPADVDAERPEAHRPRAPLRGRFSYESGWLAVECTGPSAVLLDAAPAPGWTITDAEPGPDEDVDITFTRGTETLDMEVYCNAGRPRAVVES